MRSSKEPALNLPSFFYNRRIKKPNRTNI